MDYSDISQWRVLVVDDDPDSVSVVRMVLAAAGATVYKANNGKDGLAIFERKFPLFVLTDLSMPEMDGWELLKRIKSCQNEHETFVIALTAHAMVGDEERVLAAGFDGYLSKPVKMFTFLEDLSKYLKNG